MAGLHEGKRLHRTKKSTFDPLEEIMRRFRGEITGLIVFDPDLPGAINASWMLAGLKNALPVSPEVANTLVAALHVPVVSDLRGKWKRNVDAYRYVYDHYWDQMYHHALAWQFPPSKRFCTQDFLVEFNIFQFWVSGPDDHEAGGRSPGGDGIRPRNPRPHAGRHSDVRLGVGAEFGDLRIHVLAPVLRIRQVHPGNGPQFQRQRTQRRSPARLGQGPPAKIARSSRQDAAGKRQGVRFFQHHGRRRYLCLARVVAADIRRPLARPCPWAAGWNYAPSTSCRWCNNGITST